MRSSLRFIPGCWPVRGCVCPIVDFFGVVWASGHFVVVDFGVLNWFVYVSWRAVGRLGEAVGGSAYRFEDGDRGMERAETRVAFKD